MLERVVPGVVVVGVDARRPRGQGGRWCGEPTLAQVPGAEREAAGTYPALQRFVDGWLRTGDVGRVAPDGTLEIVDRTKDLIKSGGEWISSVELERHLAAHPAVKEAAVVAVPNERWGERPAALVVLREGTDPSNGDIAAFLSTKVASWQIPDHIEFVKDLPKTGVGKIDKRRLRDEVVPGLLEGMSSERPV